jgi:hypothetical protein
MNNRIYYRTGTYDPKKGYRPARQDVAYVAAHDEYREHFMQRVQTDEHFRHDVGWTKKPVDQCVARFVARVVCFAAPINCGLFACAAVVVALVSMCPGSPTLACSPCDSNYWHTHA